MQDQANWHDRSPERWNNYTIGNSPLAKGSRADSIDKAESLPLLPRGGGRNNADTERGSRLPQEPPLTLFTKLAFACGTLPGGLTTTCIGFFFQTFLMDIINLDVKHVGIIILVGRVWDGFSGPLSGYLAAKTNTRWGSLKPWVTGSIIPFAIFYVALWSPPPFEYEYRVAYIVIIYVIFTMFLNSFNMPYSALTVHLSNEPSQRDSAVTYQAIFGWVSILGGALIQGLLTQALYGAIGKGCTDCTNMTAAMEIIGSRPQSKEQWKLQLTFMLGAGVLAFISIISGLLVIFNVKEQSSLPGKSVTNESFWVSVRHLARTKSYIILVVMIVFAWMSVAIIQSNLILYLRYVVHLEDHFQDMLGILLFAACISSPFWLILCNKIGKKWTYIMACSAFAPLLMINYFLAHNVKATRAYAYMGIMGSLISPMYLIPATMLPDVVDEAMLRDDGRRREAMFYACFVFFQKFASGLGIYASTICLDMYGSYKSGCCTQEYKVEESLRIILGPTAGAFIVVSLICAGFYPITSEKAKENKVLLRNLRKNIHGYNDSQLETTAALSIFNFGVFGGNSPSLPRRY
eukprot:m.47901 g.47901  ORF g.47901 m.47901 type:complete len:576 (+) comp10540_c0_seq3:221-1948(+)